MALSLKDLKTKSNTQNNQNMPVNPVPNPNKKTLLPWESHNPFQDNQNQTRTIQAHEAAIKAKAMSENNIDLTTDRVLKASTPQRKVHQIKPKHHPQAGPWEFIKSLFS
jgi:hypothetical protein